MLQEFALQNSQPAGFCKMFLSLCVLQLLFLVSTSKCAVVSQYDNSGPNTIEEYEYIVVGSGAGGGPVASRLALAGHTVLLIDAGQDEGDLLDYRIPAWFNAATEDPRMSWGFFTRQYDNDTKAYASNKAVWQTPNGTQYVGIQPPPGSKYLGVWYPRTPFISSICRRTGSLTPCRCGGSGRLYRS